MEKSKGIFRSLQSPSVMTTLSSTRPGAGAVIRETITEVLGLTEQICQVKALSQKEWEPKMVVSPSTLTKNHSHLTLTLWISVSSSLKWDTTRTAIWIQYDNVYKALNKI